MLINLYRSQLLMPALHQHGIPEPAATRVADDICLRLRSILARWNDVDFRRTLLTLGREEATFYQPMDAELDVKALVVVAVRNSALEDATSTDAAALRLGMAGAVKLDKYMANITGAAIVHFSRADLAGEAARVTRPGVQLDPFAGLARQYPAAWTALNHLSNPTVVKRSFTPVVPGGHFPLIDASLPEHVELSHDVSTTLSGLDSTIDPGLRAMLEHMKAEDMPSLFAPSFKHLTRHPRKLLEVIEFVLSCGGAFVSPNFYISNGYVARRTALLRPVHYNRDLPRQLRDAITGAKGVHRQALQNAMAAEAG